MRKIDVEMYSDPREPSQVAFYVKVDDGTKLTPQEIVDAIAECLLHTYGELDYIGQDKLDS